MTMTLDGTAGMTAPQGAVYNGLQMATAQASTSGTSIDFTSIPVWARRVTVMLNGVSTNGTSLPLLQIGSGSVVTSGYASFVCIAGTTGTAAATSTAGIIIDAGSGSAAALRYGAVVFTLQTGNTWVASFGFGMGVGANYFHVSGGGSITLPGVLDRVRITTVNGTDTFDAGSVNIMYE